MFEHWKLNATAQVQVNVVTDSIARQVEHIVAGVLNGTLTPEKAQQVAATLQREMNAGAVPGFLYLDELMKADAWERLEFARGMSNHANTLLASGSFVDVTTMMALGRELRARWLVYAAILAQMN